MNLILIQNEYPPAIIPVEERLAYIQSLEKAQTTGNTEDYEQIIFSAADHSLDIYLEAIGKKYN